MCAAHLAGPQLLEEWLPGFLGDVEIVLDYARHYVAIRGAQRQRFLIGNSTAHVPTDLEQLVLDALALILEVLEISYEVRFRER